MTSFRHAVLGAGVLGLLSLTGGGSASAQNLINCSIEKSRPECLGVGNDGLQQRGVPSTVTPGARTTTAPVGTAPAMPGPAVTGSTVGGSDLINCSVEKSRPECLGRGNDGLQQRGVPSTVTPAARQ